MTDIAEDVKQRTREYLTTHGSRASAALVVRRVASACEALERFAAGVEAKDAARRTIPGEWCVQEIVDHVVETHRGILDELWCLLAGHRPAGPPIPAGIQSRAPLARPWPWLTRELGAAHRDILAAVRAVRPDAVIDARAPVVLVVNADTGDGRPLEWVEELDWKAYLMVLRLHATDHLHQAQRVAAAAA
jgi:hypothetical protein